MADERDPGSADGVPPRLPRARERDAERPAPPPRPPVSSLAPPPVTRPEPPPAAIVASRSLLIAGFIAGFVTISIAFLFRLGQIDALQERIADLLPDETDGTVERLAAVAFWGSIAAILVVIVVQALLLRLVMNRRRGARWLLLGFLAVHAAVAVGAAAFLGTGDAGPYLLTFLGGQLVLAGLAFVASVLPGTSAWFRRQH